MLNVVVRMIVETLYVVSSYVREKFAELSLSKQQKKKSAELYLETAKSISKHLKIFCSFERHRESEKPARDIVIKMMTKYFKVMKKSSVVKKWNDNALNKVVLAVKAFVIRTMGFVADALDDLKGKAVDELLVWCCSGNQERKEPERQLLQCYDDIKAIIPITVVVSVKTPDVLWYLITDADPVPDAPKAPQLPPVAVDDKKDGKANAKNVKASKKAAAIERCVDEVVDLRQASEIVEAATDAVIESLI